MSGNLRDLARKLLPIEGRVVDEDGLRLYAKNDPTVDHLPALMRGAVGV